MPNTTAEENPSQWASTVWFAVYVTECIMIFTINAVTLIAFARNHRLRKRTTYLIINLTVADLLVGAVTEPMDLYYPQYDPNFSWQDFTVIILYNIFPVSSLTNLSLIALERLHATLRPFRHCLIDKWAYFEIAICSWLVALFVSSVMAVFNLYKPVANVYVWGSAIVLALLILTISYVIIIVKVKSNSPQHFGSVASDRKLSVTLFIVTVVSILTILPYSVYAVLIPVGLWYHLSRTAQFNITYVCFVLYYASSLVNPLIYAIRMQEFRNALKKLIWKKSPETSRVRPIELHAM